MRDKKYIQGDIESAKKSIEETANKRLGFLLYSLQILGHKDTINIGHFHFYANKHDTGVSVRVYIKNGDETYEVINGTYWYNQSQYGHNKLTQNRGAWDSHLDDAIDELRAMAISGYESRISRLEGELEELNNFEKNKKQRFEAMFTCQ